MTDQITSDMKCSDPGCVAFRFDVDAALREGWLRVEERLYCDLHGPYAAFVHVRKLRQEEDRAKKFDDAAKKTLNRRDYRAWDEFQSDLADFHKRTGRLAHERIRELQPREFMQIHSTGGRIDIESAEEHIHAAEDKAAATRKWLMER